MPVTAGTLQQVTNMHKSALIIFLLNLLVSNQSDAAVSHNALKPVNTIDDVCEITHHSGFFALDASVFDETHSGYSERCERIGMTRTSAKGRSSLFIDAEGFDRTQWETVTLTLNVDNQDGDTTAEAAFREASYKLIGGQADSPDDKAKAYNFAYGPDLFDKIKAGHFISGFNFLHDKVAFTVDSSYSRRGGEKIILQAFRI